MFDLAKVRTVGNRSFIPVKHCVGRAVSYSILRPGGFQTYVEETLQTLLEFELKFPDREIKYWKVERTVHGNVTQGLIRADTFIAGIWIDHRPRIT